MAKFIKENFDFDGMYLMYKMDNLPNGQTKKFVARFKYGKSDRSAFTSFLIKNFAVEEYFRDLDAGGTPVGIVESKGYISPTVKRLLKSMGYPQTAEGKMMYLDRLKKA